MPLLGFSKEGLDPDAPLAHCLLEGLSLVRRFHPFQEFGVEGAIDHPTAWVDRTSFPERADLADGRISSVLLPLSHPIRPAQ